MPITSQRKPYACLLPPIFHSNSPWHRHHTLRVKRSFMRVSLKTKGSSLMGLPFTLSSFRKIRRGPQQTSPTNYFPQRSPKLTAISRICGIEMLPRVTGTLPSLITILLRVWQRCVSVRVSPRIPLHPRYFTQALRHFPILPPGPLMNETSPRLLK